MNGTIFQLQKGGSTNKASNQRPVVLPYSGSQLLNYIINNRLKRIVEQVNSSDPGQGEGWQGRSVKITMPKICLITHEVHRQGKWVYRVDIEFRNAFNTMLQAALWCIMNILHISDANLLEQIYNSATVLLAPNDAESATVMFDTVVAQGSITIRNCSRFLSALFCGCSRRLGRTRSVTTVIKFTHLSVRFRQKSKKSRTQIYMDLSYIDPQARVLNYCYK